MGAFNIRMGKLVSRRRFLNHRESVRPQLKTAVHIDKLVMHKKIINNLNIDKINFTAFNDYSEAVCHKLVMRSLVPCTNQQPPQRGGAVPGPVWVGSKWLLAFPRVPVTPGTPHSFFCYAAP